MKDQHRHMLVLIAILFVAISADARLWQVEQDGSGDFIEIQDAVDVSAPGDTVLIGPGRYDTFHPVPEYNGADVSAVVYVPIDSLTIIGVDRDQVIIGPVNSSRVIMMGIVTFSETMTWTSVENIEFTNCDTGIHFLPSGSVRSCRFSRNGKGIRVDNAYSVVIDGCQFYNNDNYGVLVATLGIEHQYCRILNNTFDRNHNSIYIGGHPNTTIRNNVFSPDNSAVVLVQNSAAVIEDCTMTGGWYGIWTDGGLNEIPIEIRNCTITGQQYNSLFFGSAYITGSNNVIGPASEWTFAYANSRVEFHNNHIHKSTLGTIRTIFYSVPDQGVDLTNNYWGTDNPEDIASWILDGVDDPSIQAIVQYEPFFDHPIGTEAKSVSELKGMFR